MRIIDQIRATSKQIDKYFERYHALCFEFYFSDSFDKSEDVDYVLTKIEECRRRLRRLDENLFITPLTRANERGARPTQGRPETKKC